MLSIQPAPEAFGNAWEIAMRVNTSGGGLRSFRRMHPELSKADSDFIWRRVWDRSERVKYLDRSNGGHFLNTDRLGCPDGGNRLRITYGVSFADDDGNAHEQIFHVMTDLAKRIGGIRDEAEHLLRVQLRDRYFEGQRISQVANRISNVTMLNVTCLTAGE